MNSTLPGGGLCSDLRTRMWAVVGSRPRVIRISLSEVEHRRLHTKENEPGSIPLPSAVNLKIRLACVFVDQPYIAPYPRPNSKTLRLRAGLCHAPIGPTKSPLLEVWR